jgi:hypothetical protein
MYQCIHGGMNVVGVMVVRTLFLQLHPSDVIIKGANWHVDNYKWTLP